MATATLATLALALFAAPALASVCSRNYHGRCVYDLTQCRPGDLYQMSYCGFLQYCCVTPATTAPPRTTRAPASSGGSSSSFSSSSDTCGVSRVGTTAKIVGGTEAVPHEFPWQVSLMYNGHHMCGGTLIGNQFVLTAAHCFEGTSRSGWRVALGVHDRNHIQRSNYLRVTHIWTHGQFDQHGNNGNDIALMQLEKAVDVSGTNVRTACLPNDGDDFTDEICLVTGWGSTREDGPSTRKLQKVEVPIISKTTCNYWLHGNYATDTNICAGLRQGGKDACQGDSGGPLICKSNGRWKLAGIVSWGFGCAQRNNPGIYTKVESYLDWIKAVQNQATSGK